MLVYRCQERSVGEIYPFHGYSNSCGKIEEQRLLTKGRGEERLRVAAANFLAGVLSPIGVTVAVCGFR
jgi:hypothetical protein